MSITRIFRVRIHDELRPAFEAGFASISMHAVRSAPGFLSAEILQPSVWAPNEYAMISRWKSEAALRDFAGEDWSRAVIPADMEHYVSACWVHHYASWPDD